MNTDLARRLAARVPGARAINDFVARFRRPQLLQHPVGRRRPRLSTVIVEEKVESAADIAIAERLLVAYRAATAEDPAADPDKAADIWTELHARSRSFISVLDSNDPRRLARYLCNASRHDAMHGISQGDFEYARIARDRSYRDFHALVTQDKLVSLAEGVGALPVENPEQGTYGRSLYTEPAQLVAAVEARLGIDITPPDVDGCLLKLRAGARSFNEKDLSAVYTAYLLRNSLPSPEQTRICEIGGGAGRLAYWSTRLDMAPYTVVDLPRVNVLQGYYLLRTLPADKVLLFGEQGSTELFDGVRILPAQAIEGHAHEYDVVVNQDSLPEMDSETVRQYLRWIKGCSRRLLSINQENKPPYSKGLVHVSVPESIEEVGDYRLLQRFPYWMRKGYVAELYAAGG